MQLQGIKNSIVIIQQKAAHISIIFSVSGGGKDTLKCHLFATQGECASSGNSNWHLERTTKPLSC